MITDNNSSISLPKKTKKTKNRDFQSSAPPAKRLQRKTSFDNDENSGVKLAAKKDVCESQALSKVTVQSSSTLKSMKPWYFFCCTGCDRTSDKKLVYPTFEDIIGSNENLAQSFSGPVMSLCREINPSSSNSNNNESIQYPPRVNTNKSIMYLKEQEKLQHSSSNIRDSTEAKIDSPVILVDRVDVQSILQDYIMASKFYGCQTVNPGVLTTIRYSLPTLCASGFFHDADMLALSEIMHQHGNSSLKHIRRLDFSLPGRQGKLNGKKGFQSHGAFALSKFLLKSKYVEEVYLQRNFIGPDGATALFEMLKHNRVVKILKMRRCGIGEGGAMAFADMLVCRKYKLDIDLSVNRIGVIGCQEIEAALTKRYDEGQPINIKLEGNLVFPEIMNGVTHLLGIILSYVGYSFMSHQVKNQSQSDRISCAVFSVSLLVLYTSSTLYHSFFALTTTRHIFSVLDKCAIYILIAGTYTPLLRIALKDSEGSLLLLTFIWMCSLGGVFVEAFYPKWIHKAKFSLSMYLGLGWACVILMSDMIEKLPLVSLQLLFLGGVGYTSGVPFFVRNNNLDHSIWHLFVLTGSVCHWFCIFLYLTSAALDLDDCQV